ncbi:MAG: aspartate aminotransferase family protein [Acidimicrobiales bacterium]|jgi:glutamate-1-semialdehyde 2,1-aminomutase|nr:aspartate aminotransferase family protein [Actinomycetota bacterium]MDP6062571.1 aspartate aminotransferase family protein [Acidimicrobiales bacterium]MDP6213729.1 aspartate aminotransferase family protein [Acidimicrobiales bacterium]MDP7208696.1 aspartate aminotransferase family protein [Acidimicrobiales bacterium]HJO99810.1 aspartate aminotransferase family protein [Acidimicrobiales bacterium]|tara:strand:- start:7005 stop:8315 length:1311 start_codon:yes stop_codon:yes gene_type:complete
MRDNGATSRSEALYERAQKVLPGGVSRNTVLRSPYPVYAAHAEGCYITDVDGVERIDFANNMASLIHGHAHPAIVAAVADQMTRGTAYTMATEAEIRYAEHLCSRNDGFDQLRFVNSGTEAVMAALKVSRAFTGRPKIAKVEGAYHGSYDFAEVSQTAAPANWGGVDAPESVPVSHGTPRGVLDDVVVLPFNDVERAVQILDRHSDDIACVLVDLMPHRVGLCPATQDFVDALRSWTTANGALLVADEVITFRGRCGGAQQGYNLRPDLTAMAKMIGGGFPVGAIAGRREVMQVMNPRSDDYRVPHSGTFSANPITMTAGRTAMELFDEEAVARLNNLNRLAMDEMTGAISRRGVEASVSGAGSLFQIHMTNPAPTNYRDAYPAPEVAARLSRFVDLLLGNGILLASSGTGILSTPMGEDEIGQLVAAVDRSLAGL